MHNTYIDSSRKVVMVLRILTADDQYGFQKNCSPVSHGKR